MPDDRFPNAGNDLVRIHKVITRALDVSLQSVQNGEPIDEIKQGLKSYVHVLTILLHSHHAGEDELSFPFWRVRMPEGPFDLLTDQHQQMITYLQQIEKWLETESSAWLHDHFIQLRTILIDLQKHWLNHITLEEATIGPESSMQYLTQSENEELIKQLSEHGQVHSQPPELVMPFIVYNLSEVDRAEFIRLLPPVIIQQLIPFAWKEAWAPMKPFLLAE
jgi:hypothetical protein